MVTHEFLHGKKRIALCCPTVKVFTYLGLLFTSEGKIKREMDRPFGTASAFMLAVHPHVVVKMELSQNAKLLIY